MASAAEQLASSLNWGAIGKAAELKKRPWFTLGALVVFRFGAYIPVPGVDPAALAEIFKALKPGGVLSVTEVLPDWYRKTPCRVFSGRLSWASMRSSWMCTG